jgi:hypothetical protein
MQLERTVGLVKASLALVLNISPDNCDGELGRSNDLPLYSGDVTLSAASFTRGRLNFISVHIANNISACWRLPQWSERQVSQLQCTSHINIVFAGVNTVATVGDIRLQRL